MKKKILVTGGGGVLGSLLVSRLKELGYQLAVMDNKNTWPESVACDIRDYKQVYRISKKCKPDILVHLAGITGNLECETNVHEAIRTNVMGTYNVLQANAENRTKVIFASTREIYGDTDRWTDESSAINPKNINGITKIFGERLIHDFHASCEIPFVILRFSNFFGENNERKGISAMIKNAIRKNQIVMFGGAQEIDPLHYNDAVVAVTKALEYDGSDTFNIACGRPVKVREIVRRLEDILGRKIKIASKPQRKFESTHCRLDTSRAEKLLKFRAVENLDSILSKMISRWTAM